MSTMCQYPKCAKPAALRVERLGDIWRVPIDDRLVCWEHGSSAVDDFRREWNDEQSGAETARKEESCEPTS